MDSSVARPAIDPGDLRPSATADLRSRQPDLGRDVPVNAQPTWFGPENRPLFGWMHLPGSPTVRGMALLCPPLGRESANAQWALQRVADRLAGTGIAALRVSYGGTGDSAGSLDGPDRLTDWLTSIHEAIDFARRCTSAPLVVIGMRMGGLLAAEAIARGAEVDALIHWDPYASGKDFLRQEQTLLAAGYGAQQIGDGSVAGPAFTFGPDTAVELSDLLLGPCPSLGDHRTLVVAREGARKIARARQRFDGHPVDWVDIDGQADLMDVPPDMTTLPETAIGLLVDWASKVVGTDETPVTFEATPSAAVEWLADGRTIVEDAVWLGPNRLFAMITRPASDGTIDPPLSDSDMATTPTLVFLSAGALDHTGPGRMWVDLARSFARQGFCSVRVDFDGIGETYGRPGVLRNSPLAPHILDDVVDVAAALGDPEGRNLVYIGLSSGGYHAIEAGLRLHLRGVCAINAGMTGRMPERESGPVDPRRSAYKPMPAPLANLAVRHHRIARHIWRTMLIAAVGASPHASLAALGRRGTPLLLITSEVDGRQFETSPFWWVSERRRRGSGDFEFVVVPGGDHSLYTVDGRTDAYPVLRDWIESRYGSDAPGT